MTVTRISVNRAAVLTLWAAVVARRLGFDRDEALTMGRVIAGLNAYAKGKSLGIYEPHPETLSRESRRIPPGTALHVNLLNRAVPVVRTNEGLRALSKGNPVTPDSVARYLEAKFGDTLSSVEEAMMRLAASIPRRDLAARAYELYESFRPRIPSGIRGWGAAGDLDLERVARLRRTQEAE